MRTFHNTVTPRAKFKSAHGRYPEVGETVMYNGRLCRFTISQQYFNGKKKKCWYHSWV